MQKIKKNEEVIKNKLVCQLSSLAFFEFILLLYYILYVKASFCKSIDAEYFEIFCKYLAMIELRVSKNPYAKELRKINLATDKFQPYWDMYKNIIKYTSNEFIVNIFNIMYGLRVLAFVLKNDSKIIESLFTHDLYYISIEELEYYKFYPITILSKSDIFNMGFTTEKCDNITNKIDFSVNVIMYPIVDINVVDAVHVFPETIVKTNKKYKLIAKIIWVVDNDYNYFNEVVIRCKDKYYRVSKNVIVGCNGKDKLTMNKMHLGYMSTCDVKCFDNFTQYAIYHIA